MAFDSNRRALRAGLPWIAAGVVFLVAGHGAPAVAGALGWGDLVEAWTAWTAAAGALGSGLVLVGLARLARARIAGRFGLRLAAAAALWGGELALRLAELAGVASGAETAAARLVLAAAAMAALAWGMAWIGDGNDPSHVQRSWVFTRALFAVQLAALLALLAAGALAGEGARSLAARFPGGLALSWILFAGPYLHLCLSLQRTLRWAAHPGTLEEVLRAHAATVHSAAETGGEEAR